MTVIEGKVVSATLRDNPRLSLATRAYDTAVFDVTEGDR
jgi:hypothetical protein